MRARILQALPPELFTSPGALPDRTRVGSKELPAQWTRLPDPRSKIGSFAFQDQRLRVETLGTVRAQEVSNRSHVPGMGWKRGCKPARPTRRTQNRWR
jgi:hypothetical protein